MPSAIEFMKYVLPRILLLAGVAIGLAIGVAIFVYVPLSFIFSSAEWPETMANMVVYLITLAMIVGWVITVRNGLKR